MLSIVANLKYYSDNTEQIMIEKQVKNKTFWKREKRKEKKDDNKKKWWH